MIDRLRRVLSQWAARFHAHEVEHWANRLDKFEQRLPRMLRKRGYERTGRLVRDVLQQVAAAQGEDAARRARERLRSPTDD